jgi:hypothetical protein
MPPQAKTGPSKRHWQTAFKPGFDYRALEPRQLLAGDVSVTLKNADLTIAGDIQGNSLTLRLGEADQVILQGNQTTLNGGSDPIILPRRLRNVSIDFGTGNNSLQVFGLSLRGDLQVRAEGGNQLIDFQGLTARQISVRTSSGDDTFSLKDVTARRELTLIASGGDNVVALQGIQSQRQLSVQLGQGNDMVATEQLRINRDAIFQSSGGDNQILMLGPTRISRLLEIQTGAGDDSISLVPQRVGQSLTVRRLMIETGEGDDQVFLDENCRFQQRVLLDGKEGENLLNNSARFPKRQVIEAFSTDGEIPINQMVHECWDLLNDRDLDAEPFGEVGLTINFETQFVSVNSHNPGLSARWDDLAQQAVLLERTGPTIASRAYGMVHTAIFNAWAAYDLSATPTLHPELQRPATENSHANKTTAMSFAAHRVLSDLFPSRTQLFDRLMEELGLNRFDTGLDPATPSGIGNLMAQGLLQQRHLDGSNQTGQNPLGTAGVPYSDISGYQAVNSIDSIVDLSRWTPERFPLDAAEGDSQTTQQYLTPHWGSVQPFGEIDWSAIRPGPPKPFLLVDGTVDFANRTITTATETLPITRDLIGTVINPAFIQQAEEVVEFSANLTDRQKVIAEFWEDGPGTSFPPGTWMTFGKLISARNNHSLDQDARLFFALGNAVMNAGIGSWEAKGFFDYARPVRAIRNLAELGLIGQFNEALGGYAIEAWVPNQGTQTILGTQFTTYQKVGGNPSPPFAEFTSGHSTFSAAGAEVLRSFTGSDTFNAKIRFQPGLSLFEPGITPGQLVELRWPTFTAAADEAGMSRMYGGIHFMDGNLEGLAHGTQIGQLTWQTARSYFG